MNFIVKLLAYVFLFTSLTMCSNQNQSKDGGSGDAAVTKPPPVKPSPDEDVKEELPNDKDTQPIEDYSNLKCQREDCIKQINCQKQGAKLTPPNTIDSFIDFLNLLPKPLNGTCILAALPRPLAIHATSNLFSAQPPGGPESPRILIRFDNLILSFVPDGSGSQAIEVSEITAQEDSIKGDIPLPITTKLEKWAPYEHLYFNDHPSCAAICHSSFREVKKYENDVIQYASQYIKPFPNYDVTLIQLKGFWDACVEYQNTALPRCEFYNALFEFGEVKAGEF